MAGAGKKTEREEIGPGHIESCGDDLGDPGLELRRVHKANEDFCAGGTNRQEVHPALNLSSKGATKEDAVVAVLDELGVGMETEGVLGTTQEVQGDGKGRGTDRCRIQGLGGAHGRQLGGEACRIGETVEEAPVEVVQQVVLETGDARTQDAGHVGRVLGTVDEPVHGDVTAHAVMHEVGPVGDLGGEGGTVEERLVEVGDVGGIRHALGKVLRGGEEDMGYGNEAFPDIDALGLDVGNLALPEREVCVVRRAAKEGDAVVGDEGGNGRVFSVQGMGVGPLMGSSGRLRDDESV